MVRQNGQQVRRSDETGRQMIAARFDIAHQARNRLFGFVAIEQSEMQHEYVRGLRFADETTFAGHESPTERRAHSLRQAFVMFEIRYVAEDACDTRQQFCAVAEERGADQILRRVAEARVTGSGAVGCQPIAETLPRVRLRHRRGSTTDNAPFDVVDERLHRIVVAFEQTLVAATSVDRPRTDDDGIGPRGAAVAAHHRELRRYRRERRNGAVSRLVRR